MKIKPKSIFPLLEHPTPNFCRDSYLSLNGIWQYAITKSYSRPKVWDGDIVVPYSPESQLSNVNKQLGKHNYLHYLKYVVIPNNFNKGRILLNIGAIDQRCEIYINAKLAGRWDFNYIPLEIDITPLINFAGDNEIYIIVQDDADSDIYAKGKQSYHNKGIWYTAISGIYRSVFLQSVPKNYIKSYSYNFDSKTKTIIFNFDTIGEVTNIHLDIYDNENKIVNLISYHGEPITYTFGEKIKCWSPEKPFLYDVEITYDNEQIKTYFALKEFKINAIENKKIFSLNGKNILLKGLLYQGYFQDGIYTPKCDEDYVNDIKLCKNMGFNCLRVHAKIESQRFYYHCDRLGIIVIQDFVNGGRHYNPLLIILRPFINFSVDDKTYKYLGRKNPLSRQHFVEEIKYTISYLKNNPSVCIYTIFNEGWGQFDSASITDLVKKMDNSKVITSNSGWFDQGTGDCDSHHVYFKAINLKNDHKRVLLLDEFGGFSLKVNGHNLTKKKFGYKKMNSKVQLMKKIEEVWLNELLPTIKIEGLSGYVYTQFNDVEGEINGLVTYDREVVKVDVEKMKKLNKILNDNFDKLYK